MKTVSTYELKVNDAILSTLKEKKRWRIIHKITEGNGFYYLHTADKTFTSLPYSLHKVKGKRIKHPKDVPEDIFYRFWIRDYKDGGEICMKCDAIYPQTELHNCHG